MSLLAALQKNKQAILLAEIGALIHDIDKLMPEFLQDSKHHSLHEEEQDRFKYVPDGETVVSVKQKRRAKYDLQSTCSETLNLPNVTFKTSDVDALIQAPYTIGLFDAFDYHHYNNTGDPQPHPMLSHLVHAGMGGCDGLDSELDKDGAKYEQRGTFCIDTPFGYKSSTVLEDGFSKARDIVQNYFLEIPEDIGSIYKDFMEDIKAVYEQGLGETRYPCNDVTLWAHSYSVASMTKALLVKILLEIESLPEASTYELPGRFKKQGQNRTDFIVMQITFDIDYLLRGAQKTGDVMGLIHQVLLLQKDLRDFVHTKLLIGNEIYCDQNRQLFLIPQLRNSDDNSEQQLQEEFQKEVRDSLFQHICHSLVHMEISGGRKLPELPELPFAIKFAAPIDASESLPSKRLLQRSSMLLNTPSICQQYPANLSIDKDYGERCGVCGVRAVGSKNPYREEKLCKPCFERRTNDEIKRERNRWNENWTSDLQDLLPSKSEENKLAFISLSFNLSKLNDGTIFEKVTWKSYDKRLKKDIDRTKNPSLGRRYRAWETLQDFLLQCRQMAAKNSPSPIFPVTLEPNPERMEFIVRGSQASDLMLQFYSAYQEQFSKFRDCLPFSIGCAYFYKKFPLYAVMDVMKNMRESFKTPGKHNYCVHEKLKPESPADEHLEVLILKEEKGRDRASKPGYTVWPINTQFSNTDIKKKTDKCHPYFGEENKLVGEIKKDDKITSVEGFFDFLLVDSSQARYAFSKKGRRHHILGNRPPYPVGILRDFDRLQKILSRLTDNQLGQLEDQLVEKMQSWGQRWWDDPSTVEQFCRLVLMSPNALGKRDRGGDYVYLDQEREKTPFIRDSDKEVLVNAAMSGLLLDVLDLYKHLEKTL